MVIEVVAEFRAFFLFTRDDGRDDVGILPQVITHFSEQGGVFGEALHQNVARAVEGGLGVRYAFVGVDEFRRFGFRVVGRLVPQQVGQRLKTRFNRTRPRVRRFGLYGR